MNKDRIVGVWTLTAAQDSDEHLSAHIAKVQGDVFPVMTIDEKIRFWRAVHDASGAVIADLERMARSIEDVL